MKKIFLLISILFVITIKADSQIKENKVILKIPNSKFKELCFPDINSDFVTILNMISTDTLCVSINFNKRDSFLHHGSYQYITPIIFMKSNMTLIKITNKDVKYIKISYEKNCYYFKKINKKRYCYKRKLSNPMLK